jgi:hypothetical protein
MVSLMNTANNLLSILGFQRNVVVSKDMRVVSNLPVACPTL